ncbi:unnamed protein product [Protopolystoma xenopodis]|uniref:Uncharacterized protein n=1 Tax=Protopolystoma xenopodis TaxID=117903 RepID=A0A3S5FBN3_9PLAT|nr:unnamed protein product [Protopolystoma xenopodis]
MTLHLNRLNKCTRGSIPALSVHTCICRRLRECLQAASASSSCPRPALPPLSSVPAAWIAGRSGHCSQEGNAGSRACDECEGSWPGGYLIDEVHCFGRLTEVARNENKMGCIDGDRQDCTEMPPSSGQQMGIASKSSLSPAATVHFRSRREREQTAQLTWWHRGGRICISARALIQFKLGRHSPLAPGRGAIQTDT